MDKKLADKLAKMRSLAKTKEEVEEESKEEEVPEEPEYEEDSGEEEKSINKLLSKDKEIAKHEDTIQMDIARLQNNGLYRAEILYQFQLLNSILAEALLPEKKGEQK